MQAQITPKMFVKIVKDFRLTDNFFVSIHFNYETSDVLVTPEVNFNGNLILFVPTCKILLFAVSQKLFAE